MLILLYITFRLISAKIHHAKMEEYVPIQRMEVILASVLPDSQARTVKGRAQFAMIVPASMEELVETMDLILFALVHLV